MSINEITGDKLQTKTGNKESKENFDKGWDLLFGNKPKVSPCQGHAACSDGWVLGEPATEVKQDSGGCCGECH